jgi:hypothetical protein
MKILTGITIATFFIIILLGPFAVQAAEYDVHSLMPAGPSSILISDLKIPLPREGGHAEKQSYVLAEPQDTLRGLEGFMVFVEIIDADVENHGLTRNLLRKEVESRLRRAEIPVLTPTEAFNTPGKPHLYLHLTTHNTGIDLYSFAMRIELSQDVCLIRDPSIKASATTWVANVAGIVGAQNLPAVAGDAAELTEKFIREYRAANRR